MADTTSYFIGDINITNNWNAFVPTTTDPLITVNSTDCEYWDLTNIHVLCVNMEFFVSAAAPEGYSEIIWTLPETVDSPKKYSNGIVFERVNSFMEQTFAMGKIEAEGSSLKMTLFPFRANNTYTVYGQLWYRTTD